MKHMFRNTLMAAGLAALAGMTAAATANAQVVLTPQDRTVVYRDLTAYPYPQSQTVYYYPRDYVYSALVYAAPRAYYWPVPRWRAAVGEIVPREVVLQPVPETVAVPAVSGYSYAVVQDRVVLADPDSREIFEVLEETSQ